MKKLKTINKAASRLREERTMNKSLGQLYKYSESRLYNEHSISFKNRQLIEHSLKYNFQNCIVKDLDVFVQSQESVIILSFFQDFSKNFSSYANRFKCISNFEKRSGTPLLSKRQYQRSKHRLPSDSTSSIAPMGSSVSLAVPRLDSEMPLRRTSSSSRIDQRVSQVVIPKARCSSATNLTRQNAFDSMLAPPCGQQRVGSNDHSPAESQYSS